MENKPFGQIQIEYVAPVLLKPEVYLVAGIPSKRITHRSQSIPVDVLYHDTAAESSITSLRGALFALKSLVTRGFPGYVF